MLHLFLAAVLGSAGPTLDRLKVREDQYTHGSLHKDARLLNGVFAQNFIDTTTTGTVITKRQYLENVADPSWTLQRIDIRSTRYIMQGDTAVVNAEYRLVGQENGKPVSQHGRSTDVWVWQHGDWWCIAAHSSVIR